MKTKNEIVINEDTLEEDLLHAISVYTQNAYAMSQYSLDVNEIKDLRKENGKIATTIHNALANHDDVDTLTDSIDAMMNHLSLN